MTDHDRTGLTDGIDAEERVAELHEIRPDVTISPLWRYETLRNLYTLLRHLHDQLEMARPVLVGKDDARFVRVALADLDELRKIAGLLRVAAYEECDAHSLRVDR